MRGWRMVGANAKQRGTQLGSHLTQLWVWEYFHTRRLCKDCFLRCVIPPEMTGTNHCKQEGCCIFGRGRMESCSLLHTLQCMGTHRASSKGFLVLGLKKGVTHTSDMA